jgi:hypothetical protein
MAIQTQEVLSLGQDPKLSHAGATSVNREADWVRHPSLAAAICEPSCCDSFKTHQQKRSRK